MRRGPSKANQEMMNRLLDDLFDQFVTEISRARSLGRKQTLELIDGGPLTSVEAQQANLVDELLYPDQYDSRKPPGVSAVVGLRDYISEEYVRESWSRRPVIALVVAEGDIGDSSENGGALTRGDVSPGSIRGAFKQVKADGAVKGVTLRVNSPGGSALASDLIYRETILARKLGPLNVSMSGVAASGGYYISSAADRIFANPATFTGSIGIYALKPVLSGLYEKIDLGKQSYHRGKNAGIFSLSRPFSGSERLRLKKGLDAFYQRFLEIASGGRGLSADSVDHLAGGRVWTGSEATEHGLVDTLGGLWQSLVATAGDAGIEDFEVKIFPRKRTLFSFRTNPLLGPLGGLANLVLGAGEDILGEGAGESLSILSQPRSGYYMRLPFDLTVE